MQRSRHGIAISGRADLTGRPHLNYSLHYLVLNSHKGNSCLSGVLQLTILLAILCVVVVVDSGDSVLRRWLAIATSQDAQKRHCLRAGVDGGHKRAHISAQVYNLSAFYFLAHSEEM